MLRLKIRLNDFIRKLKHKCKISQEEYNSIHISSAAPGILYGLPKVHKANTPVRPIMSAIGTYNRSLAKFLVPLLQPLTQNEFTINSTQDFARIIQNLSYEGPIFLTSFDVLSLFTNIPVPETIDIILNSGLRSEENMYGNFTEKEFKGMLELATSNNLFYFNEQLYRQIDSMAMGSSISCCFANIFMGHHEKRWIHECPTAFKPKFIYRYIDDYIIAFASEDQAEAFYEYVNNKHRNISFTREDEQNGSLNFLDLTITHQNGTFRTKTYRKPTHTGLGTNYTSFIAHVFKLSSIRTLLHRAYTTSTSWIEFDEEVSFLTKFFEQNNYPAKVIQNQIRSFKNKIFEPKELPPTVQKQSFYIKLQYLGPMSFHVRNQLCKLLTSSYPQLDFKYIFVNKSTVSNLFKFKDKIPTNLQSLVTYEYTCVICNNNYVGLTTCNLGKRIADHMGKSELTGKDCKKPHSAILDHHKQTKHPIQPSDFKIIGRAASKHQLELLEAIQIAHFKPKLNIQVQAAKLYTL